MTALMIHFPADLYQTLETLAAEKNTTIEHQTVEALRLAVPKLSEKSVKNDRTRRAALSEEIKKLQYDCDTNAFDIVAAIREDRDR